MVAEPPYRFFERNFRRRLRDAKLADGFAAVVVHVVLGHFDTFQRDARWMACQVCRPLVEIGKGENCQARKFNGWSFDAGQSTKISKTSRNIKFLQPRM